MTIDSFSLHMNTTLTFIHVYHIYYMYYDLPIIRISDKTLGGKDSIHVLHLLQTTIHAC